VEYEPSLATQTPHNIKFAARMGIRVLHGTTKFVTSYGETKTPVTRFLRRFVWVK